MTPKTAEEIYQFDQCSVLIVDDDDFNHDVVSYFLDEIGIKTIFYGRDGIEGLELIELHRPDLVILDIVMPRLGGLDMLRELRARPGFSEIPVIVQTGNDSTESRDSMFAAGATDYVTKPLNVHEFQGRVKTHLKNLLLVKGLETRLDDIAREMRVAADLQRSMLPTSAVTEQIKSRYGVSIYSLFEPCSALGGDFFGLTPLTDQTFAFYLCDFAGHGVGAALNTVRLHTMVGRLPPPDPSNPAGYLAALNADLCVSLTNRHYATLLYGIVDVSAKTFTYSSAGAPSPLSIVGSRSEWLDSRGMPLGLVKSAVYDNHQIKFEPGSQLFLYSDAMTESETKSGTMFGPDAVSDIVMSAATTKSNNEILECIINTFTENAALPLDDDLTALHIVWQ